MAKGRVGAVYDDVIALPVEPNKGAEKAGRYAGRVWEASIVTR
jgi:hypothetical protein